MQTGKTAAQEGKCRDEAGAAAETSLTETIRRHDTGLTALNAEDGLTADRIAEDEETGPLSVCVFRSAGEPNP